MAVKKKYNYGGREVMGEEIPFEAEKENWNVYLLEDGTTLKMKAVVGSIVRLDEYSPTGEPIYLLNASNVVNANVPDQLKKK
jgi:hypothetical protein